MDQEIEPVGSGHLVAKLDHLSEFPTRVDMEQRKRQLGGIEGLQCEMQHHGRVLADGIEHHRAVTLGHHLAHDVNTFCLERLEMSKFSLSHEGVRKCARAFCCRSYRLSIEQETQP